MQVCVLGVDKERAGFIPLAVKETRGSTPVKKLSVDSFLLSVTIPPCSSSETREGEGGEGEKGENQGVNERERGREEKKQAGEEESKKKGKEKKSKEIKKETKKRDREVQGGVCVWNEREDACGKRGEARVSGAGGGRVGHVWGGCG
ncbi:hypothetical protein DIZ76_010134 [Coccidioides immitis]|uniref:Uncharacterized protein n=1 Tax=Coccidioides immitis RMSCC 2394 TaxID=404692 RepID=A0A0J7AXU0_COCIT|nr:hypothetical protein CIRG_10050 [Coccidioides immitis RMSCC 2394]TPX24699.1 hypothetical protein DIZ76_010134 [Coccidioides immitis]